MIRLNLKILGKDETIFRPVYAKVTKDLLNVFGLPKDTSLSFNLGTIEFKHDSWIINGKKSDTFGDKQTMVNVDVAIGYKEESIRSSDKLISRYDPILEDKDIDLKAAPNKLDATIKLNGSIYTKSKTTANTITDVFRALMVKDELFRKHTVDYYYHVDQFLWKLIYRIFEIKYPIDKEKYGPLESGFKTYLREIGLGKITAVDNLTLDDRKISLAFIFREHGINGNFSHDLLNNEANYNTDSGYWEIPFGYEFTFNAPESVFLNYQPMVYNKYLGDDYALYTDFYKHRNEVLFDGIYRDVNYFSVHRLPFVWDGVKYDIDQFPDQPVLDEVINQGARYLKLPDWDTSPYEKNLPFFSIVASFLLAVDEDSPILLNLLNLGDYKINKVIEEYLRNGNGEDVTTRLSSVIYFELRENGIHLTDDQITIDNDLNIIYLNGKLDRKKTYMIYFHICTDVDALHYEAKLKYKNNEDLFNTHIEAISLIDGGKVEKVNMVRKTGDFTIEPISLYNNLVITGKLLDRI